MPQRKAATERSWANLGSEDQYKATKACEKLIEELETIKGFAVHSINTNKLVLDFVVNGEDLTSIQHKSSVDYAKIPKQNQKNAGQKKQIASKADDLGRQIYRACLAARRGFVELSGLTSIALAKSIVEDTLGKSAVQQQPRANRVRKKVVRKHQSVQQNTESAFGTEQVFDGMDMEDLDDPPEGSYRSISVHRRIGGVVDVDKEDDNTNAEQEVDNAEQEVDNAREEVDNAEEEVDPEVQDSGDDVNGHNNSESCGVQQGDADEDEDEEEGEDPDDDDYIQTDAEDISASDFEDTSF